MAETQDEINAKLGVTGWETDEHGNEYPVAKIENTILGPEIYDLLPTQDLRDGMEGYIEKHLAPGHFLEAVLAGDLYGGAQHADRHNQPHIVAIAKWVWEYAPTSCYGSVGRVEAWLDR